MPEFQPGATTIAASIVLMSLQAGAALARAPEPPPAGSKYVAMGSSFAAGPGISQSADTPPTPCARSMDNYAHQIARKHGLVLIDVSCSGAVTANLLSPWNELPAELDAVDRDTRLVTVTIGGNDVGYIGGLAAASCQALREASSSGAKACPTVTDADDQSFADLEARMRRVAAEVHGRAPAARLVFVDYPPVLPAEGVCSATPLSEAQADTSRQIAKRLADVTASVARESDADLIAASQIAAGHDACADDAWMNGYPRPGAPVHGAPYHPRLAAMTAIADALDRLIWR
jgi:lysophospholipase L1-like esterase